MNSTNDRAKYFYALVFLCIIATAYPFMNMGATISKSRPWLGIGSAALAAVISWFLFRESRSRHNMWHKMINPPSIERHKVALMHLGSMFFGFASICTLSGSLLVIGHSIIRALFKQ
jgi:hypothetical protein